MVTRNQPSGPPMTLGDNAQLGGIKEPRRRAIGAQSVRSNRMRSRSNVNARVARCTVCSSGGARRCDRPTQLRNPVRGQVQFLAGVNLRTLRRFEPGKIHGLETLDAAVAGLRIETGRQPKQQAPSEHG
jgi:hypothetical protein